MSVMTVFLTNDSGDSLTVDREVDGNAIWRFDRVLPMKAFLLEHLGGVGYVCDDNLVLVPHTVTGFIVYEDDRDITDEASQMVDRAQRGANR